MKGSHHWGSLKISLIISGPSPRYSRVHGRFEILNVNFCGDVPVPPMELKHVLGFVQGNCLLFTKVNHLKPPIWEHIFGIFFPAHRGLQIQVLFPSKGTILQGNVPSSNHEF